MVNLSAKIKDDMNPMLAFIQPFQMVNLSSNIKPISFPYKKITDCNTL
jgi:hypothetical protein